MKLGIAEIKGVVGKSKDFHLEEEVPHLEYAGETLIFVSPIQVGGTVINTGNRIYKVEGSIGAVIETSCHRCLKMTRFSLDIEFCQEYSDFTNDEEIERFSGDDIELLPQVLNEIVLNLPGQILCDPNCRGLCLNCGIDLNTSDCRCDKDKVDPRLEILKQLLKDD